MLFNVPVLIKLNQRIMTKAELKHMAETQYFLTLKDSMLKADMVKAIETAKKEKENGTKKTSGGRREY